MVVRLLVRNLENQEDLNDLICTMELENGVDVEIEDIYEDD